MEAQSDESLVRAAAGGDQRAYAVLIARHQETVAKFIWRLIPIQEDREEVCQDVFVKAYMNLSRFQFDSKFTTWLYSIAHRTAISFLRKKKYDFEPVDDNQDAGIRLDRDLEEEDIARLIAAEVQNLGVEERSVVTLYHVQGCSVDEISGILEKPAGTIKSILFRVRKKLKDRIAPVVGDYTELEESVR